jgi:tight adherence protein C
MTAIAALLCAIALALCNWRAFADPVAGRLARLVPLAAEKVTQAARDARALEWLYRALKTLDPSFAASEPMLRSLGVVRLSWLVAAESAKLAGALVWGAAVGALTSSFMTFQTVIWSAPIIAFFLFIMAVNKLVKAASLRRRNWLRRELALGIEMLCIFLEGGQSLDQAFRSFCEICSQALPRLAIIQRTLVTELDNGVPYAKAYEHWAENVSGDDAQALAALFTDSLVHGTELAPHLRQFSLDMIEQRVAGARASIGVKSSQLTVVMVVFFLPAILGFVTAPAIAGIVSTLGISR